MVDSRGKSRSASTRKHPVPKTGSVRQLVNEPVLRQLLHGVGRPEHRRDSNEPIDGWWADMVACDRHREPGERYRRAAACATEWNGGRAHLVELHVVVCIDEWRRELVGIVGNRGDSKYPDAAGIRSGPLPSAAVDGAGKIWVVWEDCRFRAQCATNDLVYSTSTDGTHWSKVTRIPIDPVTSVVDHFIPGIGIDPATSGATAHVGVHYYYYGQSNCTVFWLGSTWATFVPQRRGDVESSRKAGGPGDSKSAAEFTERIDGW